MRAFARIRVSALWSPDHSALASRSIDLKMSDRRRPGICSGGMLCRANISLGVASPATNSMTKVGGMFMLVSTQLGPASPKISDGNDVAALIILLHLLTLTLK